MNNLSASFAQHPALPPSQGVVGVAPASPTEKSPGQTRTDLLETAQRWAHNAHQHAVDVTGEARTAECDEACAVSLCNMGDIASLLGDFGEARRRYQQGRDMSEKMGLAAGVSHAEAGLRGLPK